MMQLNSASTCPYFWQHSVWSQLTQRLDQGNLPHALLLLGPRGLGKMGFACAFARYLLCAHLQHGRSCEQDCRPCQLLAAGTHPDQVMLMPEGDSTTIKVDQIRDVVTWISQTSQQGSYKVVIINPANAMNIAASNALLKTLEEPTANTFLILVSEQLSGLSATIRSRCQSVTFQTPDVNAAKTWLNTQTVATTEQIELALTLAADAPLRALSMLQGELMQQRQQLLKHLLAIAKENGSPLQAASQTLNFNLAEVLEWFIAWIMDIVRTRIGDESIELQLTDSINFLTVSGASSALYALLDELLQARQQIQKKMNINPQLLLEKLFCSWQSFTQSR